MKQLVLMIALVAIFQRPSPAQDSIGESQRDNLLNAIEQSQAETEVWIFRLKDVDAESLVKTLRELFGKEVRITGYSRTNSLVAHGSKEQIEQVKRIVEMLEKQRPGPAGLHKDTMEDLGAGPGVRGKPFGSVLLPLPELKRLYKASEERSQELAARLRESSKRLKPGSKQLAKMNQQLQESVSESFSLRQDLHLAGIAQFEQKVRKMKALLAARDRIKVEIINRRIEDLKNPVRRWNEGETFPHPERGPSPNEPQTAKKNVGRPLVGLITGVDEKGGLVEISVGADDGVKPGTVFNVIRKGLHVGKGEVIEMTPDRSIGRITQRDTKKTPVQAGDQIRTEPKQLPAETIRINRGIGLPGPAHVPGGLGSLFQSPDGGNTARQSSTELETLRKLWSQRVENVKRMQGTVHCFTYDKPFATEKRSVGVFDFEAPDKWMIDLKPQTIEKSEVSQKRDSKGKRYKLLEGTAERWVADGKRIWWATGDSKQVHVLPTKIGGQGKIFLSGMMSSLLNLPLAVAEKKIHLRVVSSDAEKAVVEITPLAAVDSANWKKASVIFDKNIQLPRAIQWFGPNGNLEMVYSFSDIRINAFKPDGTKNVFESDKLNRLKPEVHIQNSATLLGDEPGVSSVQLKLAGPKMATILWTTEDRDPSKVVILPSRIDVPAAESVIFQLENLPNYPNVILFGTFTGHAETPAAKLSTRHNAINIQFADEDVDQARKGNLVTKVYYLPKNSSASPVQSGPEVLTSPKLEPGRNPLEEAKKLGDVLGVLRLGNRHSDIGKNEDWHKKFLTGTLSALQAEKEEVQEALALCEEQLIENPDGNQQSQDRIRQKIKELQKELEGIERREELYKQKIQEHMETKTSTKNSQSLKESTPVSDRDVRKSPQPTNLPR